MNQSSGPAPLLQNALRFLEAGDTNAAQILVDTHIAKNPADAEAHNISGLIAKRDGNGAVALEAFMSASRLAPGEPLYVINRAMVLADLDQAEDGLRALEAVLQLRPGHCDALLARALMLQRLGRLEDAIAGARMATVFHRTSAKAQQMMGTMLLKAKRTNEAVAALSEAVRLEPAAVEAWVNLGVAQRDAGDAAAAEASYRQALELAPDDPIAHNNLGNVLSSASRHEDAALQYRQAIALKADYAEAKANLGNTLRDLDRLDEAVAFLAEAAAQHANHAGVLNAYGNILRIAGQFDEAIEVLRRALALSPDSAEVNNNLGLVLTLKNQWDEAEGHFRKAVSARPDMPVISNNHGALLLRMFRFEDAIKALGNAIARDPDYDEAMCNLGVAHYMLGQADQAIDVYSRVVKRSPDNAFARFGLASTLLEDQRLAQAEEEIRKALAIDPDNAMAHNTLGVLLLDQHFITPAREAMKAAADKNTISAPVFYSNYAFASLYEPDITNAEVLAIQTEFGRRFATTVSEPTRPHANTRDPDRKITLAYMSSDFRTHSVAYFFEPLMEKHDRAQFKIVIYSNTSRRDRVTEELKKAADVWVETLGLTDDAFARRVREDQIDILVDLGGHTSGNRLPVAARKLAPVQVEYLGYPETTGVAAMDYRLTDSHTDPEGVADATSTEKLIRLPDCFHCYRPHVKAPPPAPAPHVKKGYVTYASFNVLPKVNDRSIGAWSEILKAVPTARYYIKCKQLRDPSVQGRIRDDFARFGVDPARIDMESFVPSVNDHLSQYGMVDLALDTFPYNGTTTTCEAMWMGVPVLSLIGNNHRSRVGLSLLSAMGLATELAAPSVEAYIERAVTWGKNPQYLAEIRQKMRPLMAASPLRDEVGFTRKLEHVYRDLWQKWCAGPPTFELKAPPDLRPEDSIQGVVVRTFSRASMPTDPRFNVALKYVHAGLNDAAWDVLQDVVAEPAADLAALQLAVTLRLSAGAYADVIVLCERILGLDPGNVIAWDNIGTAHDQLGRPDQAIAAYDRAIALAPGFALPHNNRGVVLLGQGRFAAAAQSFAQALSHDSQNVAAHINLGVAQVERGDVATGAAQFKHALALDPGNKDAWDNLLFALHNIADDPADLCAQHQAWGQTLVHAPAPFANDRTVNRKLRIGYMSPDFRRHSVGYFVEALLSAHDRQAFDVFCFADVARPDATTQRFQGMADQWRDIRGHQTEDVIARIRSDQIDILVDLAGHTMGNRLNVFAARAAPVQVTAIGYPGTTGLAAFDGRISDDFSDPAADDVYSAEPLLRLDGGMHCYTPPLDAPVVGPLPFEENGFVTFGSFNKLAKISPSTIALWAQVLAAVPRARLLIKTKPLVEDQTSAALAAQFVAHGIAAERLELRGWDPDDRGHLGVYNRIDLALDTAPYNGTTTTCEALWMGVPVITLSGRTHASRVGASLLASVGKPEWVCTTPAQYVACAAALSAEPAALSVLRAGLRATIARSALCDAQGYTRAVENAYRRLWAAFLRGN